MQQPEQKQRLQKLLAASGIASRRIVEEMIIDERIALNGKTAILGDKASSSDLITLDGFPVILSSETKTFLLNKPTGVISTASDEKDRTTVVDLIPSELRLFPIGRLDAQTTGLILVSNDGQLTYKLTHPKFGINKKYLVKAQGSISEQQIQMLRDGIELDDGITAPAKVKLLGSIQGESLLEITIHEGKNRQIRRMMAAIGHEVITLQRIQIGSIRDPSLKPGQYRELTALEVYELYSQTDK